MRIVLWERCVKVTSACVCLTEVSKKTLDVQSIEGFSSYHNFAYQTGGLRVWKSYGIEFPLIAYLKGIKALLTWWL